MKWTWEKVDPDKGTMSGDLAKVFKNEEVYQPGVFAAGAPSPDATLLAREVLQNSWDAARELQTIEAEAGRDAPEFEITFRFHELHGHAKSDLVGALDLRELSDRASTQNRLDLGLGADDCLDHLDTEEPLRVLEIVESATTGMGGSWAAARSKLYLALVSMGFTEKGSGSGGSYGYGKSGLIRGSSIRTVFAYTCFREEDAEPGITRRALGMTYWGGHDLGSDRFNGLARFGQIDPVKDVTIPLMNDAADGAAVALGLDPRDPDEIEELGTTFLLVDPTIEPDDLRVAIERNWWPAILEGQFHVEIVDVDGTPIHPRPRQDPALLTFIRSFELATVAQDNDKPDERQRKMNAMTLADGTTVKPGTVGLVSDAASWSWPKSAAVAEDEEPIEHRSLVALVRGPRMVVEYHDFGASPPFVRGAFVADDDIDELLRQTEPKAHDAWQTKGHGEGVTPDAIEVAKSVQQRIRTYVNEFRKNLKPPTPDKREIRLPVLEDLFRDLVKPRGGGPVRPKAEKRPTSIQIIHDERLPVDDHHIRFEATARFALSQHAESEAHDAEVQLRLAPVEDGRAAPKPVSGLVDAPPGWTVDPDKWWTYRGKLTHEPITFTLRTDPYSSDWTGELIAAVELIGKPSSDADENEGVDA